MLTFAEPLNRSYMYLGDKVVTRRERTSLYREYLNACDNPEGWGYTGWQAWRQLAECVRVMVRDGYGITTDTPELREKGFTWQQVTDWYFKQIVKGVYEIPTPEKTEPAARPATFDHASMVDHCAAQFFISRPENERDTSTLNEGGSVASSLLEAGTAYAKAVACMDSRNLRIARQPHGPHFMPFLSYAYNYTATAIFHRACAMLLHGTPLDMIPPALNWHGWPEYLNNWQEA